MDHHLTMVHLVVLVEVEPVVPVDLVVLIQTISKVHFQPLLVEMENLLLNSLVLECH
jgi:hypothetical protein